ncbi:MAG: FMN-binding negative transcriptional regulator [Burkholderiales bacterium]|nr:FMN-binding negative transcriptional regulator [Burkholderiales bacterium]
MYLPDHFAETRVAVLHALIRAFPLGTLVTLGPEGPEANHIPFELDPAPAPFGTLRAHVARANPLWRGLSREPRALAIFQGPQAYVSPSWYPSKREHGKVVPTWNYAVVHARGTLRAIEDRAWLRALVERLTDRHEAGRAAPWTVGDAPADYVERMLEAIVGVELTVTSLAGKWKASQNRTAADRAGVVDGLRGEGSDAAAAMAELVRGTIAR